MLGDAGSNQRVRELHQDGARPREHNGAFAVDPPAGTVRAQCRHCLYRRTCATARAVGQSRRGGNRSLPGPLHSRSHWLNCAQFGKSLAASFPSLEKRAEPLTFRAQRHVTGGLHMKRVVTTASGLALAFAVSVAAQSGSTSGTQGTSGTSGTTGSSTSTPSDQTGSTSAS